jgi:hypothetical protein
VFLAKDLLLSVGCMEIDLYLHVYGNRSSVRYRFHGNRPIVKYKFHGNRTFVTVNGNRPFVAAGCMVTGLL